MGISSLRLICPRCRRVDEAGHLQAHVLMTGAGTNPAQLGALAGEGALGCSNPACRAQYPVVRGIPLVFSSPDAIGQATSFPLDLTSLSPETVRAYLHGGDPESPLAQLAARIARNIHCACHDWLDAGEGRAVPHAVQLFRWLEALGEPAHVGDGLRVVLGSALGREAWEASSGETLLADAHLPTLLATRRLLQEGELRYVAPRDRTHWEVVRLEAPSQPRVKCGLLCCDVLDPPLEGGEFDSVLSPNLVDSVYDPVLCIRQTLALAAPGSFVTFTSPFSWREAVTPRARWLESSSRCADATAEDVLRALAEAEGARLASETAFDWVLRSSAAERVLYTSRASCFRLGDEGTHRV